MPAAATHTAHTHTHREHCAFLFLKNIPIAPKPKRDDHAIQAMSPYETNMHPNREQKKPRVYRDNFVVVVFKLDQNFCYPNQVGEKKNKEEEKVFLYGPKPLQLSFSWIFLRLATFIYYIFFRTKQNRKKIALLNIL